MTDENTTEVLKALQETFDKEAGIYLDGKRVEDPTFLVGKEFLVTGIEMWASANLDTLHKIFLTATRTADTTGNNKLAVVMEG